MKETKTLRVEKTTKGYVQLEVEFPIYRKHDMEADDYDCVIFARIEANGSSIAIHRTWRYHHVDFQIEIEGPRPFGDQSDYSLGLGKYASTENEFNAVLKEFNEFAGPIGFELLAKPR